MKQHEKSITHLKVFHRYCINYYAVPHQEISELSIAFSLSV